MDKKSIIEKISAACERVVKSSNFGAAIIAALGVAIDTLTSVRDQIVAAGGEIGQDLWSEMGEDLLQVGSITDSIRWGCPTVPAEALLGGDSTEDAGAAAGEETTMMTPEEFVAMAADSLEKAAAEPKEAAARVASIKASLTLWAANDAEDAKVPVLSAARLEKIAKAYAVKKAAAKSAPAAEATEKAADVAARFDSIAVAKAAEPVKVEAPEVVEVAKAAPIVTWPLDLGRKIPRG